MFFNFKFRHFLTRPQYLAEQLQNVFDAWIRKTHFACIFTRNYFISEPAIGGEWALNR